MQHTLRFRAYLSDDVASEAWHHIDILRQIRNHAVRNYYQADTDNRPSDYDQHKKFTDWKDRWPIFSDPSAHAAQQALSQIHNDLETLKERRNEGYSVGRLKWQGAGEFRSVSSNQPRRWNVDDNTDDDLFVRLRLEKIGWFTIRAARPVPSGDEIDEVILKQEKTGNWYVSLVTETAATPEKPPLDEITPEDCIGVDLGITSYIHTSENLSVDTLDLSDEYDRYAREQRNLARKDHGSANWENQRQKVARAKRAIKCKVLDYQHKLTTWLVREYDVVAVEDLDVKPMLETSQNAKKNKTPHGHGSSTSWNTKPTCMARTLRRLNRRERPRSARVAASKRTSHSGYESIRVRRAVTQKTVISTRRRMFSTEDSDN